MPLHRIPRTNAQAGLDSRHLAERLRQAKSGDLVTYKELSDLIGVDVQKRRDLLETARHIVRAECEMVFDYERDVGLVCLNGQGILGKSDKDTARVYRAAGRIHQNLACVNPTELDEIGRHRLLVQQGTVTAVALFTHPKTLSRQLETQTPMQIPWNPTDYKDLFR